MEPPIDDLLHKVKVISQTSYGTILSRIVTLQSSEKMKKLSNFTSGLVLL
jgi:hypothetical protein